MTDELRMMVLQCGWGVCRLCGRKVRCMGFIENNGLCTWCRKREDKREANA